MTKHLFHLLTLDILLKFINQSFSSFRKIIVTLQSDLVQTFFTRSRSFPQGQDLKSFSSRDQDFLSRLNRDQYTANRDQD